MKIKNIQLKNFDIHKDVRPFIPNKDIEIKWQIKDNESYASIIGNNKHEINGQLDKLSKNIASERARTLNSLPKYKIFNTTLKRIY